MRLLWQAVKVTALLMRHRWQGCWRWLDDGRCVDCLARTGKPTDEHVAFSVGHLLVNGFSETEAQQIVAGRLGLTVGEVSAKRMRWHTDLRGQVRA